MHEFGHTFTYMHYEHRNAILFIHQSEQPIMLTQVYKNEGGNIPPCKNVITESVGGKK